MKLTLKNFCDRIDELAEYPDGWLDGEGVKLNRDGLNWLKAKFNQCFDDSAPAPACFATLEGGVLLEWFPNDLGSRWYPTLDINLETHEGQWHSLQLDTRESQEKLFDMGDEVSWRKICDQLIRLKKPDTDSGTLTVGD